MIVFYTCIQPSIVQRVTLVYDIVIGSELVNVLLSGELYTSSEFYSTF